MAETTNVEEKILAWHLLSGNMMLNPEHGDHRRGVIGETISVDGEITCCENGLHASIRAKDAIQYRPRTETIMFCRVEVWGDIDTRGDKIAGRNRRILWVVPPEQTLKILVQWATELAKQALENERAAGREPDARPDADSRAPEAEGGTL